ncbi:MAG: DUF4962 domain-containing protein, partial [Candidatus Electrothrix sp. AX5]|nr:DUF4962 domain-containing protein [Candidatus Electrothrix sp. AX5]
MSLKAGIGENHQIRVFVVNSKSILNYADFGIDYRFQFIMYFLRTVLFLLCLGGSLQNEIACAGIELPSRPFTTKVHPSEGQIVQFNPPTFVFPSSIKAKSYLLAISKEKNFPANNTVTFSAFCMLLAPPKKIEPGAYFWRWRAVLKGSTVAGWSSIRKFIVPKEAVGIPFPDIKQIKHRIGMMRPRIYVTSDTLPHLKKKARSKFGPDWIRNVEILAKASQKKILLPEPEFLPCRIFFKNKRGEKYQMMWKKYRPFFREMSSLAENYILTDNLLSGQEAKRRLIHIAKWDPRGSTSRKNNDEICAEILQHCPVVFDRVYSLLNSEEKQLIVNSLLVRMQELYDFLRGLPFELKPYESHRMGYFVPDLLQACFALLGDAPVDDILNYILMQLWSPFYPPFGGADGGWSEGPTYWGWSTSVLANLYFLVHQLTGVPVHQRSSLRNTSQFKLFGNPPYFKMSPFGDGQAHPVKKNGARAMRKLASLYQDQYALWYAQETGVQLYGIDALLFDTGMLQGKPPNDLLQGKAFPSVGLATMHENLSDQSKNVALLFRSSPFGSISHSYADQNTFAIDAYGEPLIIASGYYQRFGSPHHKKWTWTTAASNSVLINNQGQATRDWSSKGNLDQFISTEFADYALGSAHKAYKGLLNIFNRHIFFLRSNHANETPIVIIHDIIEGAKPITAQFLLHASNKFILDGSKQVMLKSASSACQINFVYPSLLQISQTNKFPIMPERSAQNQWHLKGATVKKKRKINSIITIQPYSLKEQYYPMDVFPEKDHSGFIGSCL